MRVLIHLIAEKCRLCLSCDATSHVTMMRKQKNGEGTLTLHLLFFFLLEYNCFLMLCELLLNNKVNQLYAYVSPPSWTSLHPPPDHATHLGHHRAPPLLCCRFPLAICFTDGSVFTSILISHFDSPAWVSTCPSSTSASLSCHANVFICITF